jgi:hypothetical protein
MKAFSSISTCHISEWLLREISYWNRLLYSGVFHSNSGSNDADSADYLAAKKPIIVGIGTVKEGTCKKAACIRLRLSPKQMCNPPVGIAVMWI